MDKSYEELKKIKTFEERFNYLKMDGVVGKSTFGSKRLLNQKLYKTREWKNIRDKVILRDNGCDLGINDRPICGKILIHHINSITSKDIIERNPKIFNLNNLICVSHMTHEAIHYGNEHILIKEPIKRSKNDTCPWKSDK